MPISWGPDSVTPIENASLDNPVARNSASNIVAPRSVTPTHRANAMLSEEEIEARRQNVERVNQKYNAENPEVWPSRIILYALAGVVAMQELAGLSAPMGFSELQGSDTGAPYQGDCFTDGSQHFKEVAALLQQAIPPGWDGKAADAHATAISTLTTLAQTMADLDDEMAKKLKTHAEVVRQTQLGIGIEQDVLIFPTYPIICRLESNLQTFEAAQTWARSAAGAAVLAALGLLGWCLGTSIQTQNAMNGLTVNGLGYGDVLAAAQKLTDTAAPMPTP